MSRRACVLLVLLGLGGCGSRRPTAPAGSASDSLFALGDSLYRAQGFDSARAVWAAALTRAESRADSGDIARFLTEIAIADWRLGNLPRARTFQERALGLKLRHRLGDSALSRSYNGLGLVAQDQGRNQEAVRYFERAIETARSAGDAGALARASGNIGLAFQNLGELQRAREAFRSLREAGRRLGNPRYEANGLLNEASVDIWEGDPAPAINRLDTARILYRQIKYRPGELGAFGQLATAFELTGEFNRAFAALDTALLLARDLGMQGEEADDLRLIAGLHATVGDWRRAIRYYAQADSVFRAAEFESQRGAALRGAATAYLELGNGFRARASAEEAYRLHLRSGEILEQLDDLLLLATIEETTDLRAAAGRVQAARALATKLDTRGSRLLAALGEARLADWQRDSRRVIAVVRGTSADLTPGDLWAEWELNALAARAEARMGRLDSAVVRGRQAVQAVERQRGSLSSDLLRRTLVTQRADVYGDLVLVLLLLGRTDEGFAVADAARSRGLIEHIAAVRARQAFPELMRGEALLQRIDRLMRRLRETEPTRPQDRGLELGAQDSIVRDVVAARTEYEALITRLGEGDSRAAAILGARTVRPDDVREALERDEALIEYLVTSERLIIFVIRRDGLRVLERPLNAKTLRHQVQLLRELWSSPTSDWRLGLPVAKALYHTLIAPVREAGLLDNLRRLLVIPQGVLGQLPFAALRDPRSDRYLTEDFAVNHLPSAAALATLRLGTGIARVLQGGEGFAPFPLELPATRNEVAAFRSAQPGAVVRIGREASEPAVRRALTGTGPVHVATHGILNVHNPMFSRIELAPPDRAAGPDDDGRLEVHELMSLSIRSPLVFLSGCETGAGQAWADDPVRGTADLTLAQAALSAGARNVISTLWRIRDAGGAVFAGRFYSHLQGESVSSALAAAQRESIADPAYSNPFYWAGYVLSGEGRFGEAPQKGSITSVSPLSGRSGLQGPEPRNTP